MSSMTAEYMALFRALETSAPCGSPLFSDPYAERFLRAPLRWAVGLSRAWPKVGRVVSGLLDGLWPGARASGVARTRLIDDTVQRAIDGGIDQVVQLGAGFDCRALRLRCGPATTFYEVDRPEMQSCKRDRLGTSAPNVRYVPCDFDESDLGDALAGSDFDATAPSFFVWEGVTNYLREESVAAVLRYIATMASGTSVLFTYVDEKAIENPAAYPGARLLRATLRGSRESWTFGIDPSDLPAYLESCGLLLIDDCGSVEYRARYMGGGGPHLRGYEFYRAALAVAGDELVGGGV